MIPHIPTNIRELLPSEDNPSLKSLFVAVGPTLVDALSKGEDFAEVCNRLRLNSDEAIRLLKAPEFLAYVEAYIALGDITDKAQRIRLLKAILASQIASGIVYKKTEPSHLLEQIRKELSVSDKNTNIYVQVNNTSVPRPYAKRSESEITYNRIREANKIDPPQE